MLHIRAISNKSCVVSVTRNIRTSSANSSYDTVMYAPTVIELENRTLTKELREAYIKIDTLNSVANDYAKRVQELTELLDECHYRLKLKCPTNGTV